MYFYLSKRRTYFTRKSTGASSAASLKLYLCIKQFAEETLQKKSWRYDKSESLCVKYMWHLHNTRTRRSFRIKLAPSASMVYRPVSFLLRGTVWFMSSPSFSHVSLGVGCPVTGQCFFNVSPSSNSSLSSKKHCTSGPTKQKQTQQPFIFYCYLTDVKQLRHKWGTRTDWNIGAFFFYTCMVLLCQHNLQLHYLKHLYNSL